MPPIRIEFRKGLTAHRGKLLSRGKRGVDVHAGSFLRDGLIVLDADLKKRPRELKRILLHEVAHFIWWRLGNPARHSWEELLSRELRSGARGELGWSAEWRKDKLTPADLATRSRKWREYCCESFCDSAAWLAANVRRHEEYTLAAQWRARRKSWFETSVAPSAVVPQLNHRD